MADIKKLNSQFTALLEEIKILGELSSVNIAVTEHFKLRQLKLTKDDKERELRNLSETSGPSGHQKLQVCTVCSALLSRLDNDRRLADHFAGKMHLGYAQIRKTFKALEQELAGKQRPHREQAPAPAPGSRGYDDSGSGYGGGYRGGRGGGGGYGGYGGRGRGGGGRFRGGHGGF